MKFLFFALFSILLFGSCTNPTSTEETPLVSTPETKDTIPLPRKDTTPVRIITTGVFHNEEIWTDIQQIGWIGLFKGKSGYYLKQTPLQALRVKDEVLDEEEGPKTGWKLVTPGKDPNVLLISSTAGLSERKISHVKLAKEQLFPGDTLSFRYSGMDYILFATGNKKPMDEEGNWYEISDYKLYLSAKMEGKTRKTLLSDHKAFDDSMVTLIFAGDLDGDGILDILLDDAYHYNVTEPVIYLSGKAETGQIVKRVASHTSVGC